MLRVILSTMGVLAVATPTGFAQEGPSQTFIGIIPSEPPARIALVVEGNHFLGYACGHTDEFNQLFPVWFKGTLEGGEIRAVVDGRTLSATLEGKRIRGTLSTQGIEKSFTAEPIRRSPIAGLYRAIHQTTDDGLVIGWIVDDNHHIVGGCAGKKKAFALRPQAPLPAAPPVIPDANQAPPVQNPEAEKQAGEVLVTQFDSQPEKVAVQAQRVLSPVKPPNGKVVRIAKKK